MQSTLETYLFPHQSICSDVEPIGNADVLCEKNNFSTHRSAYSEKEILGDFDPLHHNYAYIDFCTPLADICVPYNIRVTLSIVTQLNYIVLKKFSMVMTLYERLRVV